MTDFLDFQQELLETTKEGINLSKEYLNARKEYASYYNKLIALISKTGLSKSKKSIENKIAELLEHLNYGEVAKDYYQKLLDCEASYKGLEVVTKAYAAHASGLQSVIKTQISGEIAEATRNKYKWWMPHATLV